MGIKNARKVAPQSGLLQEVELLIGLPRLRDSVDKDELPISFILKRGRDRADVKAKNQPQPPATIRHVTKK